MNSNWLVTILLWGTAIICNLTPVLAADLSQIKNRALWSAKPISPLEMLPNTVDSEKGNTTNPFLPQLTHSTNVQVPASIEGIKYSSEGKHISLNFQNIELKALLKLLADFTGINMVVSDKVSGNISLRLNDIPWDQALDIILTSRSLTKREIGNAMLIAPAEEVMEHEKKEWSAAAELKNLAPLHTKLLQINYAKAMDIANLLKDRSAALLSSRGSLSVDPRTNTIWIQDMRVRLEKISEFVHRLDVPVKQVLIEARIVNATKDFARDLGIRFGIAKPTHPIDNLREIKWQKRKPIEQVKGELLAERLNLDLVTLPVLASHASVGVALAKLGNGILLDLELSALESEGKGEIIANPRLVAANQQVAVIESGEEIPYQETTTSGATAVTFKKAVLSLKVTPQITPDRKVLMDLRINQDIPSVKVFNGVPSILTKEIQTSVLINNGQTIVLGGIYKQDKYNTINRVPFLGELPLVGRLFKNRTTTIRNEELLIFITPRIITNNVTARPSSRGACNEGSPELGSMPCSEIPHYVRDDVRVVTK